MFRAKTYLSICAGSLVVQLLANRTALKIAQGGMIAQDSASTLSDPILAFIQILAVVLVDGQGLILCLVFVSMRTNGWVGTLMRCRRAYRQCFYGASTNIKYSFDPNTGDVSKIPLMLRRLANHIASMPKLLRDRRFRLKVYGKCVPGNVLLDRLVQEKLVGSRAEALELVRDLYEVGLIYHVAFEHEFLDASYFYRVVSTEGAGIAESERMASATGRADGGDGTVEVEEKDH